MKTLKKDDNMNKCLLNFWGMADYPHGELTVYSYGLFYIIFCFVFITGLLHWNGLINFFLVFLFYTASCHQGDFNTSRNFLYLNGINFRGFHGFSANPQNVSWIYLSSAKISSHEIFKTLTKRPNRHKNKESWPKIASSAKISSREMYLFPP